MPAPPVWARLYASARGVYRASVNGQPPSRLFLNQQIMKGLVGAVGLMNSSLGGRPRE